jgi:hypothetical protein
MYSCKECGMAVIVTPTEKIKACKCNAPVIMNMTATVSGIGGVKA